MYAIAAPNTPSMATPTAAARWAGVTSSKLLAECCLGAVLVVLALPLGAKSPFPLAGGVEGEDAKSDVGRAIRTTPKRET